MANTLQLKRKKANLISENNVFTGTNHEYDDLIADISQNGPSSQCIDRNFEDNRGENKGGKSSPNGLNNSSFSIGIELGRSFIAELNHFIAERDFKGALHIIKILKKVNFKNDPELHEFLISQNFDEKADYVLSVLSGGIINNGNEICGEMRSVVHEITEKIPIKISDNKKEEDQRTENAEKNGSMGMEELNLDMKSGSPKPGVIIKSGKSGRKTSKNNPKGMHSNKTASSKNSAGLSTKKNVRKTPITKKNTINRTKTIRSGTDLKKFDGKTGIKNVKEQYAALSKNSRHASGKKKGKKGKNKKGKDKSPNVVKEFIHSPKGELILFMLNLILFILYIMGGYIIYSFVITGITLLYIGTGDLKGIFGRLRRLKLKSPINRGKTGIKKKTAGKDRRKKINKAAKIGRVGRVSKSNKINRNGNTDDEEKNRNSIKKETHKIDGAKKEINETAPGKANPPKADLFEDLEEKVPGPITGAAGDIMELNDERIKHFIEGGL